MATTLKLAPGLAMERGPNGEIRVFPELAPEYEELPEGFAVQQPEEYDELPEGFTVSESPAGDVQKKTPDGIRSLGLAARYGLEGLVSLPAMAANVINAIPSMPGMPERKGFPEQQQAFSDLLTTIGLPEPQTPGERIVGDISRAVTSTGGLVKAAGSKIAQEAAPVVAKAIAGSPGIEGAASGGGSALSGIAREMGAGPVGQIASGVIGGIAGGGAGAATTSKNIAALKGPIGKLFEDISERGLDDSGAFRGLREMLGKEAERLQTEISGTFDATGKKIRPGLFDIAKERGQNVFVRNDLVKSLSSSFREEALNEIDDEAAKIYNNAASRLDSLIKTARTPGKVISINKPTTTLNDLETLRRSASKISALEGSKGYAGRNITRQVDELLDNALKDGATGDTAAIGIWKQAISKRREFGEKFERPREIADALTNKTNEEIEQSFIGAGGASLNKKLSRVYDSTLKALPANQRSTAGFMLRQSIVNRMIKNAAQSTDSEEGISAMRLANQIRNFRRDNISMWGKFSDEEKRILNHLEQQLRKTTKGGVLNIAYKGLERFLSRAVRSNLELPRTIKPKTIVDINDLIELTKIKPTLKDVTPPITTGSALGIKNTKEEK